METFTKMARKIIIIIIIIIISSSSISIIIKLFAESNKQRCTIDLL